MPVRPYGLTGTALRAARWIAAGAGGVPLPPKPPIPSPARFYCGRVRKTRNARPQKHAERITMGSLTRRNDLPICGNSPERPACRACYRSDRAFSVCNASRCKPYGLSFCGKNAVFPPTFGRAALCRRLFPFSKLKRFRLPCGNAYFPRIPPGDGRDNGERRGKTFVIDQSKIFEGWGFGGGEPLQRFPSPVPARTSRDNGTFRFRRGPADRCRAGREAALWSPREHRDLSGRSLR